MERMRQRERNIVILGFPVKLRLCLCACMYRFTLIWSMFAGGHANQSLSQQNHPRKSHQTIPVFTTYIWHMVSTQNVSPTGSEGDSPAPFDPRDPRLGAKQTTFHEESRVTWDGTAMMKSKMAVSR